MILTSIFWNPDSSKLTSPQHSEPKSLFVDSMLVQIDNFNELSVAHFDSVYKQYSLLLNLLGDDFKNDRFGISLDSITFEKNIDPILNKSWYDRLCAQVTSIYIKKFIDYSFLYFKGTEWSTIQLNFIRNESLRIKSSMKPGSNLSRLNEIQDIFYKYDEIKGFISECSSINFPTGSISDKFPLFKAQSLMIKANDYLTNNMENVYLNNCIELKSNLKDINRVLFDKHIIYVETNINTFCSKYSSFKCVKEYNSGVLKYIEFQINSLDNNNYGLPENYFNDKKDQLYFIFNKYKKEAGNHFNLLGNPKC